MLRPLLPGVTKFWLLSRYLQLKRPLRAPRLIPVPGLLEVSADEVESLVDSGLAPKPILHSTLIDQYVDDQLACLQLGTESGPRSAPDPGQFAAGPRQGSGPDTRNVTNPVTDPQAQANTKPPHSSANVHTGTIQDANQTATSVQPEYDSTAAAFHGNVDPANTSISRAQLVGPDHEEEMPDDGDSQLTTAMDSTTSDAQALVADAGLQPENLATPGQQGPAAGISSDAVAHLLKGLSWPLLGCPRAIER